MPSFRKQTLCCWLWLLGAGVAAGAQDRIVSAVDPNRTVMLKGHVHPDTQPQFDEGPADRSLPIPYATLYLKPAADLGPFLASQQTPNSPDYHRWLTPEQFGDRFGLSPGDLAKVRQWLESQGLTVHDVARGRHWITFSGTAGSLGRAFRTGIHRYRVRGELHYANSGEPSIPAAFQDVVAGVGGLDDFRLQPLFVRADQPADNAGGGHLLAPDDLATIFDITPLYGRGIDGTGQTIAVIGQSTVDLNDIRQFRSQFNLAAKDPQLVRYGANPGAAGNNQVEADLDLEWAGAVARNAGLIYVYSTSASVAAQYAVDQNLAPILTFSFGGCELESSTALRAVAQQANAQGITWFAGSGDWGAATCDLAAPIPQATKGATVTTPASFPEVTAVGGTAFNDAGGAGYWAANNTANGASALSYIPEQAWNDSAANNRLEGTGGGASGIYAKPVWQTGPGVPSDKMRDVPDVALAASPSHYGYVIFSGGNQMVVGGTSAASPAWAGLAALLSQSLGAAGLGNINPMLYRLAQTTTGVFHDVTAGDNKVPCQQSSPGCVGGLLGFSAGAGYDLATGLGSVDANNLVNQWNSGTASTTTLTAQPSSAAISDTVQLTATVGGAGANLPTGTITFLSSDTVIGSAPLAPAGTSATASISVAAPLVTAGSGSVSALYSGDGAYDPSAGSTTVTLKLPASGALLVPFVTPNPVYRNATNNNWTYTVTLNEKAGVAATLTAFTIDTNNDLSLFNSTRIPANGTISAGISSTNLKPPVNRVLTFTGTDATGTPWTQQLTVPFLDSQGAALAPAMTLTSPLSTVEQNPQADASCQWAQPLTVQETGGFEITLTGLNASGTSLSNQLQTVFGTQRLAPFGMLQGVLCFAAGSGPGAKSYTLTGNSELGPVVTASLNATLAAAPAATATFSAAPASVSLSAAAAGVPASGTVNLAFTGGAPAWTATVSPANRTSTWLTVSPASGTGNAALAIQADSTGLSPGVYFAIVAVAAADSLPQFINVPVMLQVGPSGKTAVSGLQNAFSFRQGFAPGMAMSVYGTNLAGTITAAPAGRFPLPLSLGGVSATVNGISAPLYYVSPGQLNIQVPYETGAGPAVLAVNNNGQIASFAFTAVPAAPGLYRTAISNSTGQPVTNATTGQVLLLFMTGEGDVTPSLATGATPSSAITDPTRLPHARMPISVSIGGVPVPASSLLFAGIPNGVAGLTQIDLSVPANAPTGPQPVVVTVGTAAAPPITLNITAAPGTSQLQ